MTKVNPKVHFDKISNRILIMIIIVLSLFTVFSENVKNYQQI